MTSDEMCFGCFCQWYFIDNGFTEKCIAIFCLMRTQMPYLVVSIIILVVCPGILKHQLFPSFASFDAINAGHLSEDLFSYLTHDVHMVLLSLFLHAIFDMCIDSKLGISWCSSLHVNYHSMFTNKNKWKIFSEIEKENLPVKQSRINYNFCGF